MTVGCPLRWVIAADASCSRSSRVFGLLAQRSVSDQHDEVVASAERHIGSKRALDVDDAANGGLVFGGHEDVIRAGARRTRAILRKTREQA